MICYTVNLGAGVLPILKTWVIEVAVKTAAFEADEQRSR